VITEQRVYQNVQALRGISACLVLLYHLGIREVQDWSASRFHLLYPFTLFGFSGVDLFFVISGFVITIVNLKHFGRAQDISLYWLKRFFRVFPIYWLTSLPVIIWLAINGTGDCFSIVAALALIPGYANVVNPVSWTLVHEIFFYATFAIFLLFPLRLYPFFLLVWSLGIFAFQCAPNLLHWQFLYDGTAFGVLNFNFIFGCFVALLVRAGIFLLSKLSLFLGLATTTISVSLVALNLWPASAPPLTDKGVQVVIFGVSAALILYGLTALEVRENMVLPKVFRTLGDASYSIYLSHYLVIQAAKPLYAKILQFYWQVPFTLLMFVLTLSTGLLVYFKLEKPLLNASADLLKNKTKPNWSNLTTLEKAFAQSTP
jgi:exopolysaccharide production protein ExoZ